MLDFLPSFRKIIERNGKFMRQKQFLCLFGGMMIFNYNFIPWKITFKINFAIAQVNSYANFGLQGHQKGAEESNMQLCEIF